MSESPSPTVTRREAGGSYVQSLARGLNVIAVLDTPEPLSLSEVARRAELSRAAARRFLLTLRELGYVRQTGDRFALTPRVLELGSAYLSSLTVPEIALPHIKALVELVHESGVLSVLDGDSVVGVARVPAGRIVTGTTVLGQRLPAWASASGRVLLAGLSREQLDERLQRIEFVPLTAYTVRTREALQAELDRVRAQGWAVVDQELEVGLRAVAAPVCDGAGAVLATVCLVLQSVAASLEEIELLLVPPLLVACTEIARDLAASGARVGVASSFVNVGG
jgi:IclR family pca regulon transcriptional regulator